MNPHPALSENERSAARLKRSEKWHRKLLGNGIEAYKKPGKAWMAAIWDKDLMPDASLIQLEMQLRRDEHGNACGAIANGAAITGTAIGLAGATALGMAFPPVLLLIPASLYASKVIKEYQQDAAALKHEAVLEEMTLRGLTPHSSNLLLDQIIPCLVNVAPVCVGLALHDIGLSSHLTSTLASSVPSGPLDVSACYATASLPTTSGTTSTQIIRDGSNIVAMLTPSDGTSDLGHLGADATTGFVQGVSHMAQQAHLAVFGHAIPVVGNEFAFEGGYHASIAAANEGISILAGYGVPSALSTGLETMKSGSSTSSKPGMPNMRALKKEVRRKSGKTTA